MAAWWRTHAFKHVTLRQRTAELQWIQWIVHKPMCITLQVQDGGQWSALTFHTVPAALMQTRQIAAMTAECSPCRQPLRGRQPCVATDTACSHVSSSYTFTCTSMGFSSRRKGDSATWCSIMASVDLRWLLCTVRLRVCRSSAVLLLPGMIQDDDANLW